MDRIETQRTIERLDNILALLMLQSSGADVHIVGNIRNTATGIKSLLEHDPSCLDDELIHSMVKNTEQALIAFYKDKYHNHKGR